MDIFKKTLVSVLLLCVCFGANLMQAQDLQTQLSKMGQDAAIGYTTPLLSNWANDLNTGIYHTAALHSILGFDIGVNLALARITDGDKTFTFNMPSTFNVTSNGYTATLVAGTHYPASVVTPTAVGDGNGTVIKTTAPYTVNGVVVVPAGYPLLTMPGGFNLPAVPLPMPQLALGLPFGIEVMVRYIPTVSAGDEGKFNFSGFGARYSIDQWIPMCPVNIAVHFMTQSLNFKSKGDTSLFSGKGTAYGLEVSKKFFILTLYGGFQIESSSMTLNDYTFTDQSSGVPVQVNIPGFTINGSNKSRFTVGANLLLLILNIQADYSFGTTPVANLGVGIAIR
jgi:hypothetical protein